jgi:fermentation-respiration switch protein FrsA (DUF1100 family)
MKIAILLILIGALWYSLASLERRSLYYPDRQIVASPSDYGMPFDDLSLETRDGKKIHGWFIPAPPLGGKTLLFCHGNAGNISHRLDKIAKYRALGLNVLIFDYRGYGQSEGSPSEAGTYLDAEAAHQYLVQQKKIPPEQIVLYGESLGCAVAVEMARRHPSAALILESPFTSTIAMGKLVLPWLPVRWIIRNKYDNLAKISQIHMPIMIMHSPQDEIVPFQMGQQLFAAAPEPNKFFQLTGGHNDGYETTGSSYTKALHQFMVGI